MKRAVRRVSIVVQGRGWSMWINNSGEIETDTLSLLFARLSREWRPSRLPYHLWTRPTAAIKRNGSYGPMVRISTAREDDPKYAIYLGTIAPDDACDAIEAHVRML